MATEEIPAVANSTDASQGVPAVPVSSGLPTAAATRSAAQQVEAVANSLASPPSGDRPGARTPEAAWANWKRAVQQTHRDTWDLADRTREVIELTGEKSYRQMAVEGDFSKTYAEELHKTSAAFPPEVRRQGVKFQVHNAVRRALASLDKLAEKNGIAPPKITPAEALDFALISNKRVEAKIKKLIAERYEPRLLPLFVKADELPKDVAPAQTPPPWARGSSRLLLFLAVHKFTDHRLATRWAVVAAVNEADARQVLREKKWQTADSIPLVLLDDWKRGLYMVIASPKLRFFAYVPGDAKDAEMVGDPLTREDFRASEVAADPTAVGEGTAQ